MLYSKLGWQPGLQLMQVKSHTLLCAFTCNHAFIVTDTCLQTRAEWVLATIRAGNPVLIHHAYLSSLVKRHHTHARRTFSSPSYIHRSLSQSNIISFLSIILAPTAKGAVHLLNSKLGWQPRLQLIYFNSPTLLLT